MKFHFGRVALLGALALAGSAAQASTLMMECTAQHQASGHYFIGIGPKFVGKNEALKACADWAKASGQDAGQCKIVECHVASDFNLGL